MYLKDSISRAEFPGARGDLFHKDISKFRNFEIPTG